MVPLARRCSAPLSSAAIGLLAIRTEGIYTIMITLAIGMAFFYFAQQNYAIFNGHSAASPASRRRSLFGVDWRDRRCRSTISRCCVAAVCYAAVLYAARSTFGLALQAIRDNPRRMRALGFNVAAHRVAAYAARRRHRRARPACSSSGSTAASRRARSASTG